MLRACKLSTRLLSSSAAIPRASLVLPELVEGGGEAKVTTWHVQEGDAVHVDDDLCTIDAGVVEVLYDSSHEGVLASISAPAGTKVRQGDLLGEIVEPVHWPLLQRLRALEGMRAAPSALRVLHTLGTEVDIASLKPSGPRGVLTKADVLAAMGSIPSASPAIPQQQDVPGKPSPAAARRPADAAPPAAAAGSAVPTSSTAASASAAAPSWDGLLQLGEAPAQPLSASSPFPDRTAGAGRVSSRAASPSSTVAHATDVDASPVRRVIASRLTESKATIPHMYLTSRCRIEGLLNLRRQLRAETGVIVSLNDLVIKCAAKALAAVPEANASWQQATMAPLLNDSVDVSVAVATESGLITPIVRDADLKGLSTISSEVRSLAGRARDGKLAPEEYQGGTFTISNLGMFGIDSFTAVINPPQACILAVSRGEPAFMPHATAEELPESEMVMTVSLSADRRVVDDAIGGQFLQALQTYMASPLSLL